MQLLKLVQSRVKIGAPLPWNVRDAGGMLLLATGYVIPDQQQLEAVLERGAFVDAEEVRVYLASLQPKVTPVPNLFGAWKQLQDQLETLLMHAPAHLDLPARTLALGTRLIELMDRDTDIAIYIAVRQDEARLSIYGVTHALHCALVGVLIGRRLGWEPASIMTLVQAALTMNISIAALQGQLAAQDFPPTLRQLTELRAHPAQSVALLTAAGVTDEDWLQAVQQHHERADGSGYPTGRRDSTEFAQALRHADVFMAKISPRVIRPALSIQETARQLFKEDGGGPMSTAVIKAFGIYPPGNFVQLKSGELGVVMRRGSHANTPQVAVITDSKGAPIVHTIHRDTALPEFAIAGTAANTKLVARMPPERIFGFTP